MTSSTTDCTGSGWSGRVATPCETLAESLFFFADEKRRQDLESFRLQYEAVHGPTDLLKRYTSVWPAAQQAWLLAHDPRRYFEGLPPFVQAYLKQEISRFAKAGELDTLSDEYIRLAIQAHQSRSEDREI